jgi:glycosyltransferase involved in cell wall biosynthesis
LKIQLDAQGLLVLVQKSKMLPAIAIISNSQTPYRLALHRRIARELTCVRLFSVYTHETSNSTWKFEAPSEIGPVLFGKGESCEDQDKLSRLPREWRRGGKIIAWLKQNDVKFVLVMGYNDVGRLRIIRWCRRHRVPCFLFGDSNIHGDTRSGSKAFAKQLVVSRIVRSCSGVFSCGSLGRDYFIKYGARPERIFYFPYEPDYKLIQSLPYKAVADVRQRFVLPPDRRRMVYSGRLVEVKRVDLLFAAFIAIANDRPQWDLVVVGDGSDREKLQAMVPLNLAHRFIWVGFIDDQAVVSAIYRASDVLVLPSDFEPWALVINEAAAAGMAIVSSTVVGAAAELVRDGVNGKLFAPGNLSELSKAILEVTDPAVIDRLKAGSEGVLADWRRRGDPVDGLLAALKSTGVVSEDC